ncbi:probable RNA methyltransferase CG11342 [Cylas formicarius]|uniref:probable RNA methyltransferase CG11342 n=1 Tax=Cylas formicarius TaxID=197179 RepID=UPI00295849BA|nr:probable RNA methyltransferase CG11342 [Cylas formicarius]
MEDLNFKTANPGAVQFGNFINYYKFHPPERRISVLPKEIWDSVAREQSCCILDIGCNAGDLTIELYKHISESVGVKNVNILGIDIDPVLIQRACEQNKFPNIQFTCVDIMHETDYIKSVRGFLKQHNTQKFAIGFCFSITMWIHLNHGDDGLKKFLRRVVELCESLVIEPQPWKCYRTAVRRFKLSNSTFPKYSEIKIRGDIEQRIELYLQNECDCTKVLESGRTEWGRKIMVFKLKQQIV